MDVREIIARAKPGVTPWLRTNKMRDDGKIYEVGYFPESGEDVAMIEFASANYHAAQQALGNLERHVIAGAILAALKEAGYAVAPLEPSGHAARCGAVQLRDDRLYVEEKAAACYRAMLAAAQEQEGE